MTKDPHFTALENMYLAARDVLDDLEVVLELIDSETAR